ncbi:CatB-related O-acetyltransferase [Populibacterium corticicola]|uniref:CatB-related O-acetyltransferase n=1 Tax=Populibacterium corticicola TaxID=1812826 RepID=A0ABW5XF26_9MICO
MNAQPVDPRALEILGIRGVRLQDLSDSHSRLRAETPVSLNHAQIIGEVSVGMLTYVGPASSLREVSIGRYCAIAPKVMIAPVEHPTDWLSIHPFQYDGTRQFDAYPSYLALSTRRTGRGPVKRTVVGNDVWIGDGVLVKEGITIGDGAVIGARSVVTRDVPPYTIVAGVPSRLVRPRFDQDLTRRLLALRWWDLDLTQVSQDLPFENPRQAIQRLEALVHDDSLSPISPPSFAVTRTNTDLHISSQ